LTKLAIAFVWLIGLATTIRPEPPLVITLVTLAAGLSIGRISAATMLRTLAPLWFVAAIVVVSNTVFAAANVDPAATELARIGPLRITEEGLATAAALGLRVIAIASVGAVFTLTTDSTRLVDALVRQAHVSPRFAYGALAAYQSIPRFSEDLTTLRQARRIRGLRGGWHPRLLVSLLVLAIRHGDRKALAMDARAFGSVPRSAYRVVVWGPYDVWIALAGLFVAWAVLVIGR
jgi:energy-coupling factor transport system permease protein